jgi:hypothetical protein
MPAHTAYICRLRTDIDAGTLQILDLAPNTSQHNPTLETTTQTGYLIERVENDTLAALAANATVADYDGLAAYLIDNVIDNVTAVTITVTVANAAALGLIAILDAGTPLTVAIINADLIATGGAGAGTTLGTAPCTGSVRDVLKIMSGGKYDLPSGSVVGAIAAPLQGGSFDDDGYRQIYMSGRLHMSCAEGHLAGFADTAWEYDGTAGAALVVYDYEGNVLT